MAKSPAEADEGQSRLTTAQPPYAPSAEPEPMPAQPAPPDGATGRAVTEEEEIDVWWGSYSMTTMVPSLLVCLILTGLIIWAAWKFVPRGYVQVTVLSLTGAVWLVQGVRWAYRVFGYNYRLTSRRIYADHGFLYRGYAALDLEAVASVQVKRTWTQRLLGVGQIWIVPTEEAKAALVLNGVRRPRALADRIAERVKTAQRGGDRTVLKT
jgi:uncharacterized membrane protein YdbT with pleckstrin-like domain